MEGRGFPGSCTSPTSLHSAHWVAETQSQSNISKQSMVLGLKLRFSGDLYMRTSVTYQDFANPANMVVFMYIQ